MSYAMLHPPQHLTPFGVWLHAFLCFKWWRESPHRGAMAKRQLVNRRGFVLMGVSAAPYDDLWPLLPFLVTRWRMEVTFLGLTIRWWRYTRLVRLKHRMPGLLSGRSLWTNDWSY